MFDVELISELIEALLKHSHEVVLVVRDDCHGCTPDPDTFSETSP